MDGGGIHSPALRASIPATRSSWTIESKCALSQSTMANDLDEILVLYKKGPQPSRARSLVLGRHLLPCRGSWTDHYKAKPKAGESGQGVGQRACRRRRGLRLPPNRRRQVTPHQGRSLKVSQEDRSVTTPMTKCVGTPSARATGRSNRSSTGSTARRKPRPCCRSLLLRTGTSSPTMNISCGATHD